jgi:cytochrome c-type protein NapC/trimethylamine-N-oxide reductase cytochrome c-type subunit TorC/trimethylamine-N-oxide reductase (cytochrome c) cytochrome c-type subunit TorY
MSDPNPEANPAEPTQLFQRRWWRWSVTAVSFVFAGIALVALTNRAVIWSSSDAFCGQFCHSMTWASAAYKKSPHFQNAVGVQASCGSCHIPYDSSHATATEYVYLLGFKAVKGAQDFYGEAVRTMATQEEWEKQRPQLATAFEAALTRHNYITCRGCHQLQSFGGPHSVMKQMIHQGMMQADAYDCLHCHSDIGHVNSETASTSPAAAAASAAPVAADWYMTDQAEAGSKLYAQNCASCHGANLAGGAGPALNGASWKQMYGGAKLLTVWGEIHGPMAQFAGTTFNEQQSLDMLAYLLQQNGLPAGSKPLNKTSELNRVLPKS